MGKVSQISAKVGLVDKVNKPSKTDRLDALTVSKGLFPTRESARTAIMEGVVMVDGKPVNKPGYAVKIDAALTLSSSYAQPKYVSRGGLKLEKALQQFAVDVTGRTCLDVGASTGGFTDCLLKHHAKFVYAIDVGYGQLDWSLRNDPRVKVLERVNARHLTPETLYEQDSSLATFVTMDVSFISIFKVLPAVVSCLDPSHADLILLIKPQFEAGRQFVGHGGVVRDPAVHIDVLNDSLEKSRASGLAPANLSFSPVKGPKGNIEFLMHLKREATDFAINIEELVQRAHTELSQAKADEGSEFQ